ncbi:hypothetical protein GOP47_0003665 [Adiantum capillus-veneris]|uniref:Uncharacterized protein n=1 Tax=Adiantum capillus-veneris TaxID=13818 RepID=A0A9D4ZNS0_ADICA|nr:hypothetical protein GOP47_0003665 [Adiantum capillus-veneris]
MALRTSPSPFTLIAECHSVTSSFPLFRSRSRSQLSAPKWNLFPRRQRRDRACAAAVRAADDGTTEKDVQTAKKLKLKEELLMAVEEAKDGLDERCLAAVAALEQLRQVPDISAVPHLVRGRLVGLKANFKENRVDGKTRYLGFQGAPTTLGATTFNALKPSDLKINLYTGQQHVGMDSPDSYVLFVDVDVVNPLANHPLTAQIANRARFTISGPHSMDIEFISVDIKPKFPVKDLDAWLQIFKEANPAMDEHGFVSGPQRWCFYPQASRTPSVTEVWSIAARARDLFCPLHEGQSIWQWMGLLDTFPESASPLLRNVYGAAVLIHNG